MTQSTQWSLSGTYFETCNCEAVCPCLVGSSPTEGDCTALVAWHIDKGSFGEVALDGLNVALAVLAPGTMLETKWKAAAYFDAKASADQSEALHKIFSGQAGGHPAVLASFIGEMLGAKSVPIHFSSDGRTYTLSIPGVTDAEIEVLDGQGGQPIRIENHPLAVAPGKPATVARSKRFQLTDFGFDWKQSGRNGLTSEFAYRSDPGS